MEPLDDSILEDFLVDSHEGLDRLDRDLVTLEHDPSSRDALTSAFRSLHTVKGTCSFFGFRRLERVAHAGEHILSRLRAGSLALTPAIAEGLLAVVDAVRGILRGIEADRREPEGDDSALLARLAPWLEAESRPRPAAPRAAAAPERAPAGEPAAASEVQQQYLRVDVRRLDQIMDQVGELVLARNQLLQFAPVGGATPVGRAAQRLDHVTTRLQDEIMRMRMQPVSTLWARLPRLVRDVAAACGKPVRLEMEGNATELDRTLVEALKDPLTHLVRNAIDHGLEDAATRAKAGKPAEGVLRLRAFQEGGSVHLELSDDGAGMPIARIREQALARGLADAAEAEHLTDHDWLRFVFLPGFSTAQRVTSISGRGVGLDAARAAIEGVGGSIELRTVAGAGTTFHIRLPLTLAIIPALTVEQGDDCYVIPSAHLLELVRLTRANRLEQAHDRTLYRLRGELLPVVKLGDLLDPDGAAGRGEPRHLLVLSADGRPFGLAVDRVRDTEEIVVKPLLPSLRERGPCAGATVRGDGRVALILDVPAAAARAGLGRGAAPARGEPGARVPSAARVPLLLVRSRSGAPVVVRVADVERIVEVDPAAIERLNDRPAVRFEDGVLPVSALPGEPPIAERAVVPESQAWPVLVHASAGRRWGFVVERVEDIVEYDGPPDSDRLVVRDRIADLVRLTLPASAGGEAA